MNTGGKKTLMKNGGAPKTPSTSTVNCHKPRQTAPHNKRLQPSCKHALAFLLLIVLYKLGDAFAASENSAAQGILLYGAPGTGKSLIARTLADTLDCGFIAVNLYDLKGRYIGESGQKVKEVWEKAKGDLVDDERSGDDMFLMHSIKKRGGTILFLKSPEAFVETAPARTLADFWEQRKRWASKSRHYTDPQTIAVAILVALVNVSVIISIAAAFCDVRFLSVFVLKLIIDCCLLIPFLFFSRQRHLVKFILPISIIYPFYTILTVILSTCGRYRWKDQ